MSSGVYVLQLKDNSKYYVGKSENIDKRINTHKECGENCAKFVKINGGVNKVLAPLTPSDKNLSNWEKDETISRMIKHGYNNVRGWEFTSTNKLTKEELDMIKISILGLGDRCRKCGNSGHFASGCSSGKAKWLQKLEECYPCNTSCNVMNNLLDSCYEESSSDENSSDILNNLLENENEKVMNKYRLYKIVPYSEKKKFIDACNECVGEAKFDHERKSWYVTNLFNEYNDPWEKLDMLAEKIKEWDNLDKDTKWFDKAVSLVKKRDEVIVVSKEECTAAGVGTGMWDAGRLEKNEKMYYKRGYSEETFIKLKNYIDNLNKKIVPNKKINNNKYVNERLLGKIIPPKGWSSVMSKCIKCNKNGILPFVDICANCGKNKHPDQEIHTWFLESTKIKSQKSNSKPIGKKTKVCNRCGRKGHTEDDCFAETDVNGYELSDDESEEEDCCFRCGRPGHYANKCYAKKHIDGYYIRD